MTGLPGPSGAASRALWTDSSSDPSSSCLACRPKGTFVSKRDDIELELIYIIIIIIIIIIITKIYIAHMQDGEINRQVESETHNKVDLTNV